ncbi:MAG: flagellar assembly protein FliH [Treponemataceae bacterium]|nr:flagellar assembly protein FliH [Treponemataceae bacterium]
MAKAVFRGNEFKKTDKKVELHLFHDYSEAEVSDEVEEVPEYIGPTADDLRREAEAFKKQWEVEKKTLLDSTEAQANQIIKNAEEAAFAEVKRKTDEAAVIHQNALNEADKIVNDAKEKAQSIIADADSQCQGKFDDAYQQGLSKGHEDGYQEGHQEAERLVSRLHDIIDKTIERRQEILDETEQQIVDLVLLMSRKVVKVISENQKNVVMNNVLQALRKVKGRCDVTIHVNMEDVKLTSEHAEDFIKSVENINNISVVEDSSVDKGGCIIETDFGSVDARISSQLTELEQKILEISPIKSSVSSDNQE